AFGNWSFGQFAYTIVVIVCNLKLGLFSFYWTILSHIVIWGSIIAYILFAIIASCDSWDAFQFGQASYDLYWTFLQLLDEPSVWFGFIVLSAVALMPDMALMTIARYFYRTKTQLAQESYKPTTGEVELILHKSRRSWRSANSARSTTATDVEVEEYSSSDDIVKTEPQKRRTATVSPTTPIQT
ncbi:Hypothetical predicted protein, partial [Paramuricea clavata]